MKPKLLIVDDDVQIRSLLNDLLEEEFTIEMAVNGQEAVDKSKTWNPEVILMDLTMPEMDGITACKLIRENVSTKHIPILMLTGSDSAAERKSAFHLGADDFISKPFEVDELKIRLYSKLRRAQEVQTPGAASKPVPKSLQDNKVLVIESNPKLRTMIKSALTGTGVQTEIAKDAEEAKKALSDHELDIIFLSADMLEVADYVKDHHLKTKIVLFTKDESKEYLAKVKNYSFVSNIIAIKEEDRAFNIKSISTTVTKMLSGDIFGLEKYLNWGVEVNEFPITNSNQRTKVNDQVMAQLEELGVRSNVRTRCQTVIEELLMNAIYDAPVGADGKPLHNHKPRTEEVALAPGQAAKLRMASDGLFLAISVEDPFGAFKKSTVFKYLESNYGGDGSTDYNKSVGKGGAGKGIFMITENSDLVIYNVKPKTKTEVIAIFDMDPNKEKKTTSLHYFEQ